MTRCRSAAALHLGHAVSATLLLIALLFTPIRASATGWNDYELQIDPEFWLARNSASEIVLCNSARAIVYHQVDYPGVGRMAEYAVTDSYIFTRHIGSKPRNRFPGDTFEDDDPSREYFFIVRKDGEVVGGPMDRQEEIIDRVLHITFRKSTPHVLGPLNRHEFDAEPAFGKSAPIHWQTPKNPNFWTPLLGTLMFLAMSALILGWPVLLVMAVLLPISVMCYSRLRKRPQAP